MNCVFSPLAEHDLEEIGDYIALHNPNRAVSFIREVREQCSKIIDRPEAAALRPELGDGFRMVLFGRDLIFYTFAADLIRIERVLHGARNISALFDDV